MSVRLQRYLWHLRHSRLLQRSRDESRGFIDRRQPKRLLVLCYGNIYRSALAAGILRQRLSEKPFELRSAGFYNVGGRSPQEEFVALAGSHGIDISEHRSRVVSRSDLDWADAIAIMDWRNWESVRKLDPAAVQRIVWLGAFGECSDTQISDPYGKGPEASEAAVKKISEAVAGLADRLIASLD